MERDVTAAGGTVKVYQIMIEIEKGK